MNSVHQDKLRALLLGGSKKTYPKGRIIQFSDDRAALSIIESGYVKRYSITSEGIQSIQSIYGPDDIFPLTPIFRILFNQKLGTGIEEIYYETMSPTTIYTINATEFTDGLNADPEIYRNLLYVCGIRLNSNIHRLENASFKAALGQVAHQLIFFAETHSTKEGKIRYIDIPLTHQTLAYCTNLARETVTNNINKLQEKGLIVTKPRLGVVSLDGLRREL